VEPIVPSPGEFGYRHRVQLKVNSTGGAVRVGFFASTSHHLVPIRACLIAHPAINALLADAPSFMHRHGIDPSGISVLEFNVDGTGRTVECILHLRRRKNRVAAHGAIAQEGPDGELRVIFLNASLIRHVPVHQYDFTFPSAGGITLHSGAGVFSQNNLDLNPALAAKVLEFVSPAPGDVVADVFCGVGNYSIPLGLRAGRVVAVESNKRACAVGRRNALHHGLAGVEFLAMDAVQALDHLPRGLAAVVINPPRVGAAGLMEGLAALEPGRIVYVSCSPPTLARDMATLASLGYRPARLAPFDMFPQTHHLETVALLERGGRG
jgi:23S rRNA (uracil1939-C5)-methyltransferase